MKTNTQPKLHISLSKEHNKYQSDVADAFKSLDVSFDGGLMRFSAEEMTMQVILNIGLSIASSAMWDAIKLGVKKLHKKFSTVRITFRDSNSIMYTVKHDLSVTVLTVPNRMKEFEHIKTLDDLVSHLRSEPVSVNSAGWKETKLTDIGVFSKGSGITKDQLTKTGHNAIRYGELYTKFNFKIEKIYSYIPTEVTPTTTKIKYGDILFAGSGETNEEIGKSAAYLLNEDCYAGGDLIIFSPKNANSLFLSYFLNIGEGRKKLTELGQGQSVVHIYKSEIEKLKLNLPSILEQNRIVEVLEVWDKTITHLAKKIELKKQIKKSLMYDLLNGKKRLSGFTNEWESIKLENIATFRRGSFPQPYGLDKWYDDVNGIPFVQVYDVDNNFKLKKVTKRRISFAAQQMSVYIPTGSIVLTIQGSIGRIAITDFDAYLDRTLLFFQTFKKPMNKVFFMYSVFLLFEIEKNKADGGTIKTITKETLNKFSIKITSLKEQSEIAEILINADKEIIELERKLSLIKEQKQYLLNNLITGTIRTPETLSTKLIK